MIVFICVKFVVGLLLQFSVGVEMEAYHDQAADEGNQL